MNNYIVTWTIRRNGADHQRGEFIQAANQKAAKAEVMGRYIPGRTPFPFYLKAERLPAGNQNTALALHMTRKARESKNGWEVRILPEGQNPTRYLVRSVSSDGRRFKCIDACFTIESAYAAAMEYLDRNQSDGFLG